MKHVVVGIIIKSYKSSKKYLLISSKKNFGSFTGYYYPPGGHIKKNEDEITALKRELREELELRVTRFKKVHSTKGDVPNQMTHWFFCEVESYRIEKNNDEINDANYFTKEEIMRMKIWPSTLDFLEKYVFNANN